MMGVAAVGPKHKLLVTIVELEQYWHILSGVLYVADLCCPPVINAAQNVTMQRRNPLFGLSRGAVNFSWLKSIDIHE